MKQEEGLQVREDLSSSVTISGPGDMESTSEHRSPVGLIVRSPETQESGLGKEGGEGLASESYIPGRVDVLTQQPVDTPVRFHLFKPQPQFTQK